MQHSQQKIIEETRRFFQKVYAWMFLGLALSGLTAFVVASTPMLYTLILSNKIIFFGLLIAELILVFSLIGFLKRISANLAIFMFFLYCFMTGLTLSIIFLVYTIGSIGLVFFITAGMFGAMSTYGYFTKADLTKIGQVLIMALFGLIIASVVNLFMRNSTADFIISIIGVIIFTGLTAYDTQKIRKTNIIGNEGTPEDTKESIMGALHLYLDFINLFLKLLRLLGKKK
ncbi:MAG: Bax inhibitor-1/YccA family protein [Nanoarchaeota archaeon]|nr:Bax inhibitor-1/YccA family protein [Nanoarchaeota archaeon]